MGKIIEISHLNKAYKNGRGIMDINLTINEGEIFGFLGPNGAGKTTTMKIMTGLIKPDSGDIKILGWSILEDFEKVMENVGSIIETSQTYEYLTAYENLKQFARYYKDVDRKRIEEVLKMTGMEKFKNEKTKKFSLGMKQRVGLAAAILSHPKVVILDEPFNGLDVQGMIDMRNIIKKLAEEQKMTFFISSHLIHDVELTCNKVGILCEGRIIDIDNIENILNNYASLENYFVSEVGEIGKF